MTDDTAGLLDQDRLDELHAKLERAAQDAGLLDVAYRTVDSPVGELLLATTERGVVRVAYEREGFDDVLQTIATRVSPRVLRSPARLDVVARELDEYFAGDRRGFDIPLDFALSHGIRRVVQGILPTIAYGSTASYAEVAAAAGSPRAMRAVGTACATNPLPLLVPCHRVVRTDGTLGGYAGGVEAKTTLLRLETTSLTSRRTLP
ncbi:MAG: methylated-DNA--[protein]-cysteine S-methyltransferase [Humibacter sp.]